MYFINFQMSLLMARWRFPSLTIHGIEEALSDKGENFVIPKKVTGKLSLRTVPNQNSLKIMKLLTNYFEKKWKERNSPNNFRVMK